MSGSASGFPPGFTDGIAPLLGDELPDFLAALRGSPRRGLRFSARKAAPVLAGLAEPIDWADNAWHLPEGAALGAHPLHWAGAFYLQEPSAMAAVAALAPQPGERVLDLCAAPGGKACQIADRMHGTGLLLANDPVPARAKVLGRNLERMGITNAVVLCEPPSRLAAATPPESFDRVLVDAPCSGEGMFRKEPAAMAQWHKELPASCARRQSSILDCAVAMLRPGGLLAYSTCTFNRQENEGVVEEFLKRHPAFSLVPFALPGLPSAQGGILRLWPHRMQGEGHFVALMRKAGQAAGITKKPSAGGREERGLDAVNRLLGDWVRGDIRANAQFAGRAVSAPVGYADFSGLNILRLGLHLADLSGRAPRPEHALALAADAAKVVPLDDHTAECYRRGEELPCPAALSGFAAASWLGWNLGWGKAVSGTLKNHYPKGLRRPAADE